MEVFGMKFDAKRLAKDSQYCEELFKHYIKIKVLRKTNPDYKKYISKAVSNLELADFLLEKINLEEKEIDFVIESKDFRERACYGVDETFSISIAKMLQKQTADFVNKIKGLLAE